MNMYKPKIKSSRHLDEDWPFGSLQKSYLSFVFPFIPDKTYAMFSLVLADSSCKGMRVTFSEVNIPEDNGNKNCRFAGIRSKLAEELLYDVLKDIMTRKLYS